MGKEVNVDSTAFEAMLRGVQNLSAPVAADIVVDGDPKKYWAVVEHGSRRGHRPWPNPRRKTTVGPGGRVFSTQAVGGFVMRHRDKFVAFLRDAFLKVMEKRKGRITRESVAEAANMAAEQALSLIRAKTPVDSGSLESSEKIVKAK